MDEELREERERVNRTGKRKERRVQEESLWTEQRIMGLSSQVHNHKRRRGSFLGYMLSSWGLLRLQSKVDLGFYYL